MRKPAFCICENKDADQLRGNLEADQRLCFRYTDSTIPLLSKSKISSLQLSSVAVQPGLCRTRSETPKTGFLRTRLHCSTKFLNFHSRSGKEGTVDSEMLARTLFSLIFANSWPREFKVLANIENTCF